MVEESARLLEARIEHMHRRFDDLGKRVGCLEIFRLAYNKHGKPRSGAKPEPPESAAIWAELLALRRRVRRLEFLLRTYGDEKG